MMVEVCPLPTAMMGWSSAGGLDVCLRTTPNVPADCFAREEATRQVAIIVENHSIGRCTLVSASRCSRVPKADLGDTDIARHNMRIEEY